MDPELLMHAIDSLDRRDAIVTASGNPGSLILVDTASERGRQYADMAAFDQGRANITAGKTQGGATGPVDAPAPANAG
jgi:hypothetical protein